MTTSVGIYEFNPKDLIGHGAFAVVYKGRVKSVSTQKHQCCGPGMFIPDPNVYPGSECFPSRIQGHNYSGSRIRIKEFKYFNQKNSF